MSDLHRFRKLTIFCGMPRGGKSYYNEKFMEAYTNAGGGAMVYNYGKEKDFSDAKYTLITPLSSKEHVSKMIREGSSKVDISAYRANPEIYYFRVGRDRSAPPIHFSRFNELFAITQKRVKVKMVHDREDENGFFRAVANYISNCYVFFDDCHVSLKYFNSRHTQLFARMNHSGDLCNIPQLRGVGCDGGLAYHNFDRVREELIDYITDIVLFKQVNVPDAVQVKDAWTRNAIVECSRYLNDRAPQFSALHIDLNNMQINNVTI